MRQVEFLNQACYVIKSTKYNGDLKVAKKIIQRFRVVEEGARVSRSLTAAMRFSRSKQMGVLGLRFQGCQKERHKKGFSSGFRVVEKISTAGSFGFLKNWLKQGLKKGSKGQGLAVRV